VRNDQRVLFSPLLILEDGLGSLRRRFEGNGIDIEPVVVIPRTACVKTRPQKGEPHDMKRIRSLVLSTATRVLKRLDAFSPRVRNSFGYGGGGALLVTAHNAPNNSLPIIHRKAPEWAPLFRRLDHRGG